MPPFFPFYFSSWFPLLIPGSSFRSGLGSSGWRCFPPRLFFLWRGRDEISEIEVYPLIVGGFALLSFGHAFSSIYPWVSMQHALNIAMASIILGWAYRIVRNDPDRAWEWVFLLVSAVAVLQFAVALYQRYATGNFRPGERSTTRIFSPNSWPLRVCCACPVSS